MLTVFLSDTLNKYRFNRDLDIEHILNSFNTPKIQIQFTVDIFPDNDIQYSATTMIII